MITQDDRERAAVRALFGETFGMEDLSFKWGKTLSVTFPVLEFVEVRDVDENEILGYVVFQSNGTILTAFVAP